MRRRIMAKIIYCRILPPKSLKIEADLRDKKPIISPYDRMKVKEPGTIMRDHLLKKYDP